MLKAIKNEYYSEDVPELDTDSEIIWAKINCLLMLILQEPRIWRRVSLTLKHHSLEHVPFEMQHLWLLVAGDFNFPGWDWKTKSLKSRTTYPNRQQKFSETLDKNSLTQLVQEPTKENSTPDHCLSFYFDLVLTNQPSKVQSHPRNLRSWCCVCRIWPKTSQEPAKAKTYSPV